MDIICRKHSDYETFNCFRNHGDVGMVRLAVIDLGQTVLASRSRCSLLEAYEIRGRFCVFSQKRGARCP